MHRQSPQNLLAQLDQAVSEVFDLMLARACTPAPQQTPAPLPDLTASVRFSGSLRGACAVHLDFHSAGELTEQLTGEAAAPGSPLSADLAGELCNMIAGSWKSRLAPDLAACQLSSPTISTAPHPAVPTPVFITRIYHFDPHYFTLQLSFA